MMYLHTSDEHDAFEPRSTRKHEVIQLLKLPYTIIHMQESCFLTFSQRNAFSLDTFSYIDSQGIAALIVAI